MDFKVNIDLSATSLAVGTRQRPGSQANPDGTLNPADIEIAISLCVGCVKESSVLTAGGKRMGQMVPVATFYKPLAEFIADAKTQLGAQDAAADEKKAGELRAGLSLV